jgi:molybdate transport system permease protein
MRRSDALGLPSWAYTLAAVGLLAISLPVLALFLRADWPTVPVDLASPSALSALGLSLATALAATLASLLLGLPLAFVLARLRGRLAEAARAVVLVPLVLPPMVGGLALLFLLGRRGLLGGPVFEATGWSLPFSLSAVVVAEAFVAAPFLIVTVEGGLRTQGRCQAEAAAILGASRTQVLFRVTLPMLAPVLRGGVALCFARALGEFGATALFAGNLPGVTQTMPLAIYTAFNGAGVSQGVATSLSLLMVVCSVVLLAASGIVGRGRVVA